MKFLLLVALVALARADEIKNDRGVLVLEKDTFQTALTTNQHILVEFCEYFRVFSAPVFSLS